MRGTRAVLSGLAVFVLTVFAAPAVAKLSVFVSIPPQKTFVEKVAGEHATVQVMVKPGHSPATYEPTPRQMSAVGKADVYFRIGVPFEEAWLPRLKANNPDLRVVDLRDRLELRHIEGHHHGDDHDHDDHGARDPHVWTSPQNVINMVEHIQAVLSEMDAAHQSRYHAGASAYVSTLKALHAELQSRFLTLSGSRRFMVYHPSWGYFADAYGLKQVPIEVEGKAPGPRSLNETITTAREESIRVVFVQQQFPKKMAESVAEAIDGRVVTVDPLAEDYVANLRRVADAMLEAMK